MFGYVVFISRGIFHASKVTLMNSRHTAAAAAYLRFATDPDQPGVEKVAVSEIKKEYLEKPRPTFDGSDISPEASKLLQPQSCFFVKGWTRSVCCITVLLHAYESPDEVLKAWQAL